MTKSARGSRKKISFVIVGEVASENNKDLAHEIENRGHRVSFINLKKIEFKFVNGEFIPSFKGKRIDNHDVYIFRAYNRNFHLAQILASHLDNKEKVVLDRVLAKRLIPSKIFEASRYVQFGVPHPRTYQLGDEGSYTNLLRTLKFPIVVKPIYGQMGQDVMKFETKREAVDFFRKNPTGFFIQEFLHAKCDVRVSVVGNKAYGALRRHVIEGDFRTNTSLGAKVDVVELSGEMRRLALKATRAIGYDIAGVDIIESRNKLYFLEVNTTPQWQNVKKIAGINLAEPIIEFALTLYGK